MESESDQGSTSNLQEIQKTEEHVKPYLVDAINKFQTVGNCRKALTWKYYAKKILYYLRQQKILNNLKAFLQQPDDYESYLEGAVYIDQYCNPLSDISLKDIQAQIDSIVELVCKTLRGINTRHPSLAFKAGESSMIMEIELQSQVLDAMNYVLYDQLKFKGNRMDYYNALNLYMHQVLIRRTGIPISMSLLYLTIARQLGVPLEPVNFPSHFLLRWCQGAEGASLDIFDYIYIDAFGKGKQLTVKECEYLIGQHVAAALYGVVNVKKVLQRMVGNLLSLGKREGIDQSYQLLRDSLDLYLAMYPDQVQLLLLQARLYFHLGIWPEKSFCLVLKVLDILQHIQTLDPGQHGAVGYLVQHTLEHIERKKEEVGVEVKLRSHEKHRDVCYSIGLIMKHKRYGYNCVIYGWDPTCMMGHEWIRNMNVHSLPHGHHQPFYNVLVEDGSCRYAAQVSPQMTPAPSPECLPLVFPSTNGHSWRLFLQGHRYSLPALCHLSHWHPPDSPAGPRGDLEPSSQPHLCSHRRHTPAQQTLLFRETVLLMGPHTSGCPLWTGSLPPPHPPPRHSPTELRSGHLSLL
uniref:F-box only protein 21 isoform X7 n=1 Tax=Halichoerus grypus TaxID=9711 RepID=UPI001659AC85|nr:F-box only protein 21 isoform X7 [Halichoerus grypus]